MSPVHYAAMYDRDEALKCLWSSGAAVNEKVLSLMVNSELTPLHMAAENGCESIVRFLIGVNVSIEAKTNNGVGLSLI